MNNHGKFFMQTSVKNESYVCFSVVCTIIFLGLLAWTYWKMRLIWTPAVKHSALRLLCLGIIPFFVIGWFAVLGTEYIKELMAIALYFAGASIILLRKYAITFLRDLPMMSEYPHPKSQLQLVHDIKERPLFYIILAGHFFLTGTLVLLYLP